MEGFVRVTGFGREKINHESKVRGAPPCVMSRNHDASECFSFSICFFFVCEDIQSDSNWSSESGHF